MNQKLNMVPELPFYVQERCFDPQNLLFWPKPHNTGEKSQTPKEFAKIPPCCGILENPCHQKGTPTGALFGETPLHETKSAIFAHVEKSQLHKSEI